MSSPSLPPELRLHPALKKRLIAAFVENYGIIHVEHNMFPLYFSFIGFITSIDKVFETHGKLRQTLDAVLGENPFLEFFTDQIGIELLELDDYRKEPRFKPLVEVPGFENAEEKATQYFGSLETLPWSYSLSIELSEELSSQLRSFIASDINVGFSSILMDLRSANSQLPLRRVPAQRDRRLFKRNFFGLLSADEENETRTWKDGRALFTSRVSGYVDLYGTSKASKQFLKTLKSFFGLGLALRIFRYKRKYVAYPERTPTYAHKMGAEGAELLQKFDLSQRISDALNGISAHYVSLDVKDQDGAKNWAKWRLQLFSKLFDGTDRYQSFLTACSWYFDSVTNEDDLLGFVQAMVVLEILLGDDEPSGELTLGALLRNRCAYLIAKTSDEREKIKRDLKVIYDVRSKIVHRGKSDLSASEMEMLRELRSLCARVILAEFNIVTEQSA